MRSTTPPVRRLRHRAPRHDLLPALVDLVDHATTDDPGHVLVHVSGPTHPEVSLGLKPISSEVHPFEVLAGCTAPREWSVFGIRVRGRARHLDDPARAPVATATTFLVDREDHEASRLRMGDEVHDLPGPAVGTIPDLCRRVLGLPTPPPPTSTALLWTCIWLDRVLEVWGQPHRRRDLTSSWEQVAMLHPAVTAGSPVDVTAMPDPATLEALARSHAAGTSWEQLRHEPALAALPDGPIEPRLARWMDDGFFARWAIGAFPSPLTMVTDLRELLGDPLGPQLTEVVVSMLE